MNRLPDADQLTGPLNDPLMWNVHKADATVVNPVMTEPVDEGNLPIYNPPVVATAYHATPRS